MLVEFLRIAADDLSHQAAGFRQVSGQQLLLDLPAGPGQAAGRDRKRQQQRLDKYDRHRRQRLPGQ